jgi:hypothetical protein
MTKQLATLRARCALAGVVLHVNDAAGGQLQYTASRWSLSKTFDNLDELSAWLDRVTGVAR